MHGYIFSQVPAAEGAPWWAPVVVVVVLALVGWFNEWRRRRGAESRTENVTQASASAFGQIDPLITRLLNENERLQKEWAKDAVARQELIAQERLQKTALAEIIEKQRAELAALKLELDQLKAMYNGTRHVDET